MIFGLETWIFWLVLTALFVIVEVATANLVSVWFAAGSFVAMICAFLGADLVLQSVLACGVSGATLAIMLIFKPFKGMKNPEQVPTNSDRVIGMEGVVEEEIDPTLGSGLVKVMGQEWSAVSCNGRNIGAGSRIIVESIVGVKLAVKTKEEE